MIITIFAISYAIMGLAINRIFLIMHMDTPAWNSEVINAVEALMCFFVWPVMLTYALCWCVVGCLVLLSGWGQ